MIYFSVTEYIVYIVKLRDVINKYVDKLYNGLLIVSVLYKESVWKEGREEGKPWNLVINFLKDSIKYSTHPHP